jgi:hypothetical protein
LKIIGGEFGATPTLRRVAAASALEPSVPVRIVDAAPSKVRSLAGFIVEASLLK